MKRTEIEAMIRRARAGGPPARRPRDPQEDSWTFCSWCLVVGAPGCGTGDGGEICVNGWHMRGMASENSCACCYGTDVTDAGTVTSAVAMREEL